MSNRHSKSEEKNIKIQDGMFLMPWDWNNVPHIVIEINHECNINCGACINTTKFTKTIEQIKQEIDFAVTIRNVQCISISGGEPTLHPDLEEIVRYIYDKGKIITILSNGYGLTDDLLARLKNAGLSLFLLHIDRGQYRDDAESMETEEGINRLRHKIFGHVAGFGIDVGLQTTVYQKHLYSLPKVIDFLLTEHSSSILLSTNYIYLDKFNITSGSITENYLNDTKIDQETLKVHTTNEVTLTQIIDQMKNAFRLLPYAWLGSVSSQKTLRWIFYFFPSILYKDGSYEILHFKKRPRFDRFTVLSVNKLSPNALYYYRPDQKSIVTYLLFYGFFTFQLGKSLRFLWKYFSNKGSRLKINRYIFQQPPVLNEQGEVDLCYCCPDAIIRNGKLVPFCLGDYVEPEYNSTRESENEKVQAVTN